MYSKSPTGTGTKIKDSNENLIVLVIYMLSKNKDFDLNKLEQVQQGHLNPSALESSLVATASQVAPISTLQTISSQIFDVMKHSRSMLANIFGILGNAALNATIYEQGHEFSYVNLDYLIPEQFADSTYERLEEWKKLYSLLLIYQSQKMDRLFGANYREGEFVDHRYLIISLIGRKIKLIANASRDNIKDEIEHLGRFINGITSYKNGELVASTSDDSATISLRTVILSVKNTVDTEKSVETNTDDLKKLVGIINTLPNKLKILIESTEKMLVELTLPMEFSQLPSNFPDLIANDEIPKNNILYKKLVELELLPYYNCIFSDSRKLETILAGVDVAISTNSTYNTYILDRHLTISSSSDVSNKLSNKACFPFDHEESANVFDQIKAIVNSRNTLIVIHYYLIKLKAVADKSGQVGINFIKEEIQQLLEVLKDTIAELNNSRCKFINTCNKIYKIDPPITRGNKHKEWRIQLALHNRTRLEDSLRKLFETANLGSLLIMSGLIIDPRHQVIQDMQAVCNGISFLFSKHNVFELQTDIQSALAAPSEDILMYQEETSRTLMLEAADAQGKLIGSFVDMSDRAAEEEKALVELTSQRDTLEQRILELSGNFNDQLEKKNTALLSNLIKLLLATARKALRLKDICFPSPTAKNRNPVNYFYAKGIEIAQPSTSINFETKLIVLISFLAALTNDESHLNISKEWLNRLSQIFHELSAAIKELLKHGVNDKPLEYKINRLLQQMEKVDIEYHCELLFGNAEASPPAEPTEEESLVESSSPF